MVETDTAAATRRWTAIPASTAATHPADTAAGAHSAKHVMPTETASAAVDTVEMAAEDTATVMNAATVETASPENAGRPIATCVIVCLAG